MAITYQLLKMHISSMRSPFFVFVNIMALFQFRNDNARITSLVQVFPLWTRTLSTCHYSHEHLNYLIYRHQGCRCHQTGVVSNYSDDRLPVGCQNPPPFCEAMWLPSAQPISTRHPRLFRQSAFVILISDPPKSIKPHANALALTWSDVRLGDTGQFSLCDRPVILWSSVLTLPAVTFYRFQVCSIPPW